MKNAAVCFLSVVLVAAPVDAFDLPPNRETLKGLPGVRVVVIGAEATRATRTLRTDIELKLRMAGIKVLTEEDLTATTGWPSLFLVLALAHDAPGDTAAFFFELRLLQQVILARDTGVDLLAPTWSHGGAGTGDLSYIRERVQDMADQFINAWLSVNPKKATSP